jgi:RNA polymerase sigma-70 factor (ECF subfamily)
MDTKELKTSWDEKKETDFEELFNRHFRELHAYGYILLKDWDVAEEIVQGLFLKLWEKGNWENASISIKSYLYKSVYNESLNYIRGQKVHLKYEYQTEYRMKNEINQQPADGKVTLSELEEHLEQALSKLPEKCRAIFHLSRFEELKYQEIASQLQVSIKTVETHMGKALRILRKEMKEYLPLLAMIIFNIFRP